MRPSLLLLSLFLSLSPFAYTAPDLPRIQQDVTRIWIGPEYWTNPLMNWQLSDGRLECTHGGWVNELHALTHQLKPDPGAFAMKVRLGSLDRPDVPKEKIIFAGFKFAALGHRNDYRSNILHDIADGHAGILQQERPVRAGVDTEGRLVIDSHLSQSFFTSEDLDDLTLKVEVEHVGSTAIVKLSATSSTGKSAKHQATLDRDSLTGNIALACHPLETINQIRKDNSDIDHQTFWFDDWSVSGDKFSYDATHRYDPILWTQYTTHENTLKLMAFLVPMEDSASQTIELQTKQGSSWKTVAQTSIEPLSRTATFRIDNWDSSRGQDYRVTYNWTSAQGQEVATWSGCIRKDPTDQDTISLAGLSCSNSELFPYRFHEANLLEQDPDLVYFSGDQIYETNGGYGIVFAATEADVPRATLNYLGKFWYLGLSFRELLRDRPSVMIPDDHDVYSSDLWGKSGAPMPGDGAANDMRCFGGYRMHSTWVDVVEHTQMGHHPDPDDATLIEQGLKARYTSLDIGGVSLALINDRKFKSAPGDVIDLMEPLFAMRGGRNLPKLDTINEENFDTTQLDRASLTLLGQRQLDFLERWGKNDAQLRAVLSQSPYCQPHHLMVADFDSNGWPQSGRRRALETIRKTGAVMVHGDLHFSTLVQQGIDDWEDAGWSFTLPAVNTATHRAWRPKAEPMNHQPGMPEYTGRFYDGWGNKITMWAAANPFSFLIEENYRGDGRATLDYLREGGLGYGIVRFNTAKKTVTFESWPVYGDPKNVRSREQHPGFPRTIQID